MSLKLPRTWDFSTFKGETARIVRSKSVMPGEGGLGPGSASSTSPGPTERPLKAGWLKKQQRSLVKNWRQRYYVLRGSTLTYHKDDRESSVQGVIHLRFSRVNELPANTEEPGKYLFQIIPRSSRDRQRCPYVFMTTSHSDMEEWVRTLRRAIGGPTTGVFGKSLADTVTYDQRFGPHAVPVLVQKCVAYIREHGMDEEGIFRLPGQDNSVKQFKEAFDAGERPSFPCDTDVHTVASLLKLYLRELPEPVVPWTQYQDFLNCTCLLDPNTTGLEKLEKQISLVPRINYNLLGYICRFLFEVQLNSKVNKMSVENLATVMGINLLKPQIEDPVTMMKATPQIQKLMTVMIRQHQVLFPPAKDVCPSPPAAKTKSRKSAGPHSAPRSFVGWDCAEVGLRTAEMGDVSLSESPEEEEEEEEEEEDSPDGGDPEPFPSPYAALVDSPRQRTQTLPSFQLPPQGAAKKAEALNRWSRIQEGPEETAGTGTLSEDIFKILDLHRSSLFGGPKRAERTGREGGAAVGRGGHAAVSHAHDTPSAPRSVSQASELLSGPFCTQEPNSQQGSTQEPNSQQGSTQEPNSQQGSPSDPQQVIESLRRRNEELVSTVAELRSSLEAERRRVAALEVRLRRAEGGQQETHGRHQGFLTHPPKRQDPQTGQLTAL